jgi:hypothetical protein
MERILRRQPDMLTRIGRADARLRHGRMGGMSHESRRLAGILLIVFPTVVFGGVSLLRHLITEDPGYVNNPMRQDRWRAGHAHAGVLLLLSLVVLRYVDDAVLSDRWKSVVRHGAPVAAILLSIAYFLSVPSGDDTDPSALIHLAFGGAALLAVALLALDVGLVRKPDQRD